MKLKSILYAKEQKEICDKVIDILKLDQNNSILLYELDNDIDKQNQIMKLISDIRKYFRFDNIMGVREPEKIDRPWLSIIRHTTKNFYYMKYKDKQIRIDNKPIRTTIYNFIKKDCSDKTQN